MRYTLDISGHDEAGGPGIDRFGGLFSTIDEAENHGQGEASRGRFPFKPEAIWVRDQDGELVWKTLIT